MRRTSSCIRDDGSVPRLLVISTCGDDGGGANGSDVDGAIVIITTTLVCGRRQRRLRGHSLEGSATTWTSIPEETTTTEPQVVLSSSLPKVLRCSHGTNSITNPSNLVTTNINSIVEEGHNNHDGPVFPDVGSDGKWGDLLPPFD